MNVQCSTINTFLPLRTVVRQLVEKYLEKVKKMFAVFIDLEQAYDKVWREDLWRALREYGIGGRLLRSHRSIVQEE